MNLADFPAPGQASAPQLGARPIGAADQEEAPARVAVIVVNYNAGDLLTACVGAVLASSVGVEVVVSDNGSADGSLQALASAWGSDARLTLIPNASNLGFAKANNKAIPHTHAPLILFLNPDCLVEPGTLAEMADFMDSRPDVGMAGCLVLDPDGSEQVACRRSIPDPWISLKRILHLDRLGGGASGRRLDQRGEPLPERPIEVEAISGSFMLVRRAALEQVGPLDEGYFLHCEDLDWYLRFHAAGWRIVLVPSVSVVHHKGACSTGDPIAVERHKHRGMVRFFRKHQAERYPRAFGLLVVTGIWLHYALKAGMLSVRRQSRRLG